MGRIDAETKAFMSDPARFADVFNYFIYYGLPGSAGVYQVFQG